MGLIIAILLGGLAGWLASLIMNRDKEQGVIGNILIGILGALVGGWISTIVTGQDLATITELSWSGLFWTILGAVVVSALFNLFTRRTLR